MKEAVLITGGAGFIGTNLAHRLLSEGRKVCLFDDLSRPGVEHNAAWLSETHGGSFNLIRADIRDARAVRKAVDSAGTVFHFAAQVAVTTSLADPMTDFEINARGTLNVLEALRGRSDSPMLFYTSTNKVYGGLDDVGLSRNGTRYEPNDSITSSFGVSERRPLDFHSPYGCSKGTADQYVLDYARSYGIRSIVFRMSCIYGPHQFGNEDQGWIAHFLIRALDGMPITIYGDGMQVRDALFVDDLVDAFLLAERRGSRTEAKAFNIGGGPENTISLLELIELVAAIHGQRPNIRFEQWRTGDQRYYVSDTRRFRGATGWAPQTGIREGVERLYAWLLGARSRQAPSMAAGKLAV